MPQITLVNPPSPFLLDDKTHPPLGILYLSSFLKKYGYKPTVVDLAGLRHIPELHGDIIGFTCTTPQYPLVKNIAKTIKNTDATTIIGGPHPSNYPNTSNDFDVSVIGEGERALKFIADKYPSTYPRFLYQNFIPNIDDIPFPDRKAINLYSYHYYIDTEPATTMITSRGCPFSCGFCSSFWGKPRLHSAKYVINEIKEIQSLGYFAIHFFDDILIMNKQRLFKICNYLRKQSIIWRCFVRANMVSDEILSVMANSGCREIGIGVESGSQKILDAINKGTTVEQNTKTVELARKHNIRSKAFIIVGLPGETIDTIKETEFWLQKVQPNDVDITIYTPYKNTPITNNPKSYDISYDQKDLEHAWFKGTPGKYHSLVSTKNLSSKDIVHHRERLEKTFKKW